MDSLPPTTMPTAQQSTTSTSPQTTRPTPRIPSMPSADSMSLDLTTSRSPSPSPSPEDQPRDLSEEVPAIITSDTIPHLTDLLNRPAIRYNEHKRAWVQAKLMDAQMEMKRQRRGKRQRSSLPMGQL